MEKIMSEKKIVLTGDRPTGPLHLGHFVGSLENRLKLQEEYQQYIMIADIQALTDHAKEPAKITQNILEVALDYLSVGIDPEKSIIFVQSRIPALSELTMYYLNLVTWNRLKHNPTVKAEIAQKNFNDSVPAGFMIYPISQAADITAFKATLVPVGDDQLPMIEQTNEIVRKFNQIYGKQVLVEAKALIPKVARLPGIDGGAKMSKTLKNAIYLSDSADDVAKKVKKMYTDPNHLKVEDIGKVEGNPVFTYLDAFAQDKEKVQELKDHYQRGGLGDMVVKKYLLEVLQEFLEPVRLKRKEFEKDKDQVLDMLKQGSSVANIKAEETLKEVKATMGLY
jgi:tryptophanyl-tRNA synthetase